ncbi:MAG: hypothetical protein LBV74_00480 [Tannerella sp.]|jgi:GDP-D-mannose dehydratase|nr:hypothetical protein [Tannerella sp.]
MKKLSYFFTLLLSICLLSGCSDDNNEDCGCDDVSGISGKWKLEKGEYPFVGSSENYTKYNITIEIKSDKTLIVHEYKSIENLYFFEPNEYSIIKENDYFVSVHGYNSYWIYTKNGKLFFDLSQLDGPRYTFSCVKD